MTDGFWFLVMGALIACIGLIAYDGARSRKFWFQFVPGFVAVVFGFLFLIGML